MRRRRKIEPGRSRPSGEQDLDRSQARRGGHAGAPGAGSASSRRPLQAFVRPRSRDRARPPERCGRWAALRMAVEAQAHGRPPAPSGSSVQPVDVRGDGAPGRAGTPTWMPGRERTTGFPPEHRGARARRPAAPGRRRRTSGPTGDREIVWRSPSTPAQSRRVHAEPWPTRKASPTAGPRGEAGTCLIGSRGTLTVGRTRSLPPEGGAPMDLREQEAARREWERQANRRLRVEAEGRRAEDLEREELQRLRCWGLDVAGATGCGAASRYSTTSWCTAGGCRTWRRPRARGTQLDRGQALKDCEQGRARRGGGGATPACRAGAGGAGGGRGGAGRDRPSRAPVTGPAGRTSLRSLPSCPSP